jgi:hypothetical protein
MREAKERKHIFLVGVVVVGGVENVENFIKALFFKDFQPFFIHKLSVFLLWTGKNDFLHLFSVFNKPLFNVKLSSFPHEKVEN